MIVLYSGTPGFQSAGSREPDQEALAKQLAEMSFNPQARESLIHSNENVIQCSSVSIRRLARA